MEREREEPEREEGE